MDLQTGFGKPLMYEARLVANSLYEIYKVCEAKVL
jgi:hypothetical protein